MMPALSRALADRYTIEREIGSGGMATVYLAHDVKHDRHVAIKVLKPELGAILGVERFLAEIRVTANLQHPNILPLFDSGAAGDVLFYVMPYVEGESLRGRLDREKQLPVDDAIEIACAIARALDYAHGHGVIHRDLKPENVLLQAGQPLLADFGIALAMSRAGGQRMTESGLSLGTPQYMSPEQAAADRTIDGRADIYALGALTYEMLTGDPPHTGSTAQAIVARIMTEIPRPVRASRATVSEQVDQAVQRALAKLPADRWSTARAFAVALTDARPTSAAVAVTAVEARRRALFSTRPFPFREPLAWTLAIAGAAAAVYLATRPALPQPPVRFAVDLPDKVSVFSVLSRSVVLSSDGAQLAILALVPGTNFVYIRRLDDSVAHRVRGTDGASEVGGFSPDGRSLVYGMAGGLKKVAVDGGAPQTLVAAGHGGRWSDRNAVVYADRGSIWAVSSDGGTPRRVSKLAASLSYDDPDPLPGGQYALITIRRAGSDSSRIGVISLSDGSVADLGLPGMSPFYAAPGRVVFAHKGGHVLVAPFSLRRRAVTGPVSSVVDYVDQAAPGAVAFTVAQNGTLAYSTGAAATSAVAFYRVGRDGSERRLNGTIQRFKEPQLSPDGLRVLATILPGGDASTTTGLWLFDMRTGTIALQQRDSVLMHGEWSADGSRIVYVRQDGDSQRIVSRPWDVTTTPRVDASGGHNAFLALSIGRAARLSAIGGAAGIFLAPTDSLSAMHLLSTAAAHGSAPRLSPDGRLIAYGSDETGGDEVYVQETSPPGRRIRVSLASGFEPRWRDGTTLLYRTATRMMSATVVDRPVLQATRPDSLFADNYFPGYDLFSNGDFLMMRVPTPPKLFVVLNWPQLVSSMGHTNQP